MLPWWQMTIPMAPLSNWIWSETCLSSFLSACLLPLCLSPYGNMYKIGKCQHNNPDSYQRSGKTVRGIMSVKSRQFHAFNLSKFHMLLHQNIWISSHQDAMSTSEGWEHLILVKSNVSIT